jgi:hypothetical protein
LSKPNCTSATHWLGGVSVHCVTFQLSPARCAGHPAGLGDAVLHDGTVAFAVQKLSVEYGAPVAQRPVAQSSSERHGEQNPPSPLHTPARAAQSPRLVHLCPGSQSVGAAHSGVQWPPSQCWNVIFAGGQSPSLLHADPVAGEQMVSWTRHVASSGHVSSPLHSGVQK